MLLITYTKGNGSHLAFLVGERLYDCHEVDSRLPQTGEQFVANWEKFKPIALMVHNSLQTGLNKSLYPFIEIGEAREVKALVWPGM